MAPMTAVYVVVGALLLLGLLGSLLPLVPGTPLILLGALIFAFATDFDTMGVGRLALLAGLAVAGYLASHVAGALGARKYGGSAWAVVGALVGVVIGLFFGPLGLLLGPIVGAVAGELLRSGEIEGSLKSGVGAAVGLLLGAVAHFALALVMAALVVWWIWRG